MAKSSSENEQCCSKDCKKNNDSLNSKIKDLTGELSKANNYIYHYRLAVDQLEGRLVEYKEREVKYIEKIRTLEMYKASNLKSIKTLDKELETLKEEKGVVDGKLARLLKSSKDLERLIESQRPEKIKDGLGYNVVPPAAADLYLSPKKDLSWTGLPEFVDETVTDYKSTSEDGQNQNSSASENGEPTDSILSKHAVKFVKAVDRPAERPTTNKAETVKKPTVKYAEMKRVQRETSGSQNNAYMRPPHRPASHRPHGAPMRPPHRSAGHRPHGASMRPSHRPAGHIPQYRALWVPTVNKNFPPVNRKLLTGNSNVSTVCCCCSRHVNTARPKAVINRRNRVKDVQASAYWVWKPVKPNSASIILKRYDYVDVRGRSRLFPTASYEVGSTASLIVTRRKGKEVMVESDTPKKKKLQEQIDAQVARELEEQQEKESIRMNEQIARDAEVARIHAEEELQGMIDSLDKSNETIAKYLQEYQDFTLELPLEKRIELISDLVKYQDNYFKVYKFQSQQRRPMTKKQKREYYMAVIKSNLGWRFKDFKGMTFEEIEAKFAKVWKQVEDFIPMRSKEETERLNRKGLNLEKEQVKKQKLSEEAPEIVTSTEEFTEEKMKEIMQLVPVEDVYVQALQVKHPIIDWKNKFPLPVKVVATVRRLEMPLPEVCTVILPCLVFDQDTKSFYYSVGKILALLLYIILQVDKVNRRPRLEFHRTLTNGIWLSFNRLTLRSTISLAPQQNEACHQSEVHPTGRLMVHRHDTSLSWTRETYYELCSALKEAQAYADYAGCHLDRKSTSGSVQFLGDKLVCWSSKKQNCVSISTAESEYVVVAGCYAQVLWMRTLLMDYGFFYDKVPIYCDSKSAIAISCNPVQHTRTKHIDV
nr:uncharacterized mitochondrial protein AtMg00810-like [Tanacetum cinerariifolium]